MITIERTYLPKCTTGKGVATLNGQTYHFNTIELPWKGNERRVSCIPEGVYKAKSHNSPKFGKTFWLQNVEGRSEILMHVGNFTSDLLGCIAPGTAHRDINGDGIMDVISSRVAMNQLLKMLWSQNEFDISVTSQSGPSVLS